VRIDEAHDGPVGARVEHDRAAVAGDAVGEDAREVGDSGIVVEVQEPDVAIAAPGLLEPAGEHPAEGQHGLGRFGGERREVAPRQRPELTGFGGRHGGGAA